MAEVIVAGHICLDIIPDLSFHKAGQFDNAFQPGKLVLAGPANLYPGGAVSNSGIALHKLGIGTKLIGKTGSDGLGNVLRKLVSDNGHTLGDGIISADTSTTSYSIVINPPDNDRRFLHHSGANDDFSADDISPEMLNGARLFHFGYPPLMRTLFADNGEQLVLLMKKVKSLGLTTSLDMAYPDPASDAGKADWNSILRKTLPYVDIFVPSFDEIVFMLWHETTLAPTPFLLEKMSSELMSLGAKVILLKLGDRGLYLRTGSADLLESMGLAKPVVVSNWSNFEAWLPCFEVDVVGTTGSGDVTIAGFLASLVRGLPPVNALETALAVGACNVEAMDAVSGLLGWEETRQRIAAGWKKRSEREQFIRQQA